MKTVMIVVADKKEAFSFHPALPLPLPLCCCCCCDTNISIIKPGQNIIVDGGLSLQ